MDSDIILTIVLIALFFGGFAVLEIYSRRKKCGDRQGEQSPQPPDSTMSGSVQARGEQ
jgi:hypothetical protein